MNRFDMIDHQATVKRLNLGWRASDIAQQVGAIVP